MSLLRDVTVLTLSGRDCIAFAQAQFMSDVAALADGQWQWSGWLTPKGRVIALFALARRSADRIDLVVFDAHARALATSLQRYVFRSKVALDVRGDLQVVGRFGTSGTARGARIGESDGSVEFDMGTAAQPRTLSLLPGSREITPDADQSARWRAADMAHGLPRLGEDQREHWTPQQLSLERLQAFSVSKGCYPGQEIVARTHFLGQVKRGLVALAGASDVTAGQEVASAGPALGRVVCSAGDLSLAVLPLDRADVPLRIGDTEVRVLPLLDGLAR